MTVFSVWIYADKAVADDQNKVILERIDQNHIWERVPVPDQKHDDIYKPSKPDFAVKGIYVTGWVAGYETKMRPLIDLVKQTVLNTMVIDVKDTQGILSYKSEVDLAVSTGANGNKIRDIRGLLQQLDSEGIYTIARIVIFKDSLLANKRPELALPIWNPADDTVSYDKKWVDPSQKIVWDYNVEIAREAVKLGFDEIQFDYIRYPAMGSSPLKVVLKEGKTKSDIINEFVTYAGKRLADLAVPVSIDVFGLTTTVDGDMGIGQNFAQLSNLIKIISPMVYPSHYGHGSFGIGIPEKEPYKVINRSMSDAQKKINGNRGFKLRPWLQDFTLNYKYSYQDVADQIRAAEELGITEWLLWNPRSKYTKEAVLRSSLDNR